MLQQQALYENARLRYVIARLDCGCLGRDCSLHGSYVPEDIELYRRAKTNCQRPPDVAELLPSMTNVQDKFNQISVDDTMVAQMITAHQQGAFTGWNQMLMALVCLKTQLAKDLMAQLIAKVPPTQTFPVVGVDAGKTFNLVEDLLVNLKEAEGLGWHEIDVTGNVASDAMDWLIAHAVEGSLGANDLEYYIENRLPAEQRYDTPSPIYDIDEDEEEPNGF